MLKKDIFRSKTMAVLVLASFFVLVAPLGVFAADESPEPQVRTSLTGFVYNGGKNPLSGALVKVRNMANGREYVSEPSDANGMYKISGIDAGWYFLTVTTPEGDFNLSNGFYLKGGDVAKLSVSLQPGGALEAWGSAYSIKKPFFKTAGGITVIVLGVAGAGFGLYSLLKKEGETSPVLLER